MDESTFEYWQDKKVVDGSGEKIGSIEDVYIDEATGKREWLIVSTGLFGRNAVIPAQDLVTLDDDTIQVPFSKQQVKDSPHMDADGELSEQEEGDLYSHYGIPFSTASSPSVYADEGAEYVDTEGSVSGISSGFAESRDIEYSERDEAMTSSEEDQEEIDVERDGEERGTRRAA
jgi:sporulation protein YlmC with PRC-barrel domain